MSLKFNLKMFLINNVYTQRNKILRIENKTCKNDKWKCGMKFCKEQELRVRCKSFESNNISIRVTCLNLHNK